MRHRPLNRDTPFALWPHFDPGRWIDFNPSHVRLADGRAYAVIRRDRVPPVPGKGTVWAVAVDDAMQPAGRPFPLVQDGEDPRAVRVGDRVLVFYVLFERDGDGRITGTSMVLAEFDPAVEPWRALAHFKLPKYPLGGAPAGSNPGWEKNWVPFALSDHQVGLLYSHDPWQVIVLGVPAGSPERRFEQAQRGEGLRWGWGGVRGGTPPVPYGDGTLITFFHASEVVGSRKSYMAGACVFEAAAPFRPLRTTREPLLVAPYTGGMHRHGWAVAASVIFPLGCEATADGFRLLCGIDDGQIGSIVVPRNVLEERLEPWPAAPSASVHTAEGPVLSLESPAFVQAPGATAPPWPLQRFLALAADRGRTLLDVGGDGGLFFSGLATGYHHVEAVATSATAADTRAATVALNRIDHATVHLPRGLPGTVHGAGVARGPWALDALDEAGFSALDLVTTEVDDTAALLRGLRHTLQRDRPLMLLQLRADGSDRAEVADVLAGLGYSMEAIFPRTPRGVLCAHASRRAEIAWFA